MIKLSHSQRSPFNHGLYRNIQYVCCRRKFEKSKEDCVNSHIDWKQILKLKNNKK
jgi:hypothetical protein